MPVVASKAQWRKFGQLLDSGEITRTEFDKRVHGVNYKKLPGRIGMAKKKRKGASKKADADMKKRGTKKGGKKRGVATKNDMPMMKRKAKMPMMPDMETIMRSGRLPRPY